jgi:transposase
MVLIRAKQVRQRVKELDSVVKKYKEENPKKSRDYLLYEKSFKRRLKKTITNLDIFIIESIKDFHFTSKNENKHSLPLAKRIRLILVKELSEKGNRKTANLIDLFSFLAGTDISYKSVERLYSDDKIILALHNLFILSLQKRGITKIDACGDATGYSLTITKHYSSYAQKLKDKSKSQEDLKKKSFVYKFALMDLSTKMYVCYGSSLKSEKEAFDKAMQMLQNIDIELNSIRLDRYYSFPCYVNQFKESKVYIIPRKNVELANGFKWHETLKEFLIDTTKYLEQYFQRNNSESQFSADKKMFGWKISQKRQDRIDTCIFVRAVWHNLLLVYA